MTFTAYDVHILMLHGEICAAYQIVHPQHRVRTSFRITTMIIRSCKVSCCEERVVPDGREEDLIIALAWTVILCK